MPRIVCPKCEASVETPGDFEGHMPSEHPGAPAALGFGHTLTA